MEKLVIKNFGPISDIEIEVKKYTLLIGDTSTGKSIIAKLLCVFRGIILNGIKDIDELTNELNKYDIPYLNNDTKLSYSVADYSISIDGKNIQNNLPIISLSEFEDKLKKVEEMKQIVTTSEKLEKDLLNELNGLLSDIDIFKERIRKMRKEASLYIPAERMFFSMLGSSIAGLWANNIKISKAFIDFAAHYEVAKSTISELKYSPLNFTYHNRKEEEYILYLDKKIDLKYTSSGIQAMLPLILVLNTISQKDYLTMICIEEPEISLFPSRQKELVEYIISKVHNIDASVVITSHSPYVLSAFNNMILASNTAKEKEERKEEIKNIISEDKWIRYEDVAAYEVKDGKVISLLDEEFKGLDVNAIDKVSDIIGEQVDKLINIRYEE